MRGLIGSIILSVLLTIGFFTGLTNESAVALTIVSFCAMPFALIAVGWTLKTVFSSRKPAILSDTEYKQLQRLRNSQRSAADQVPRRAAEHE